MQAIPNDYIAELESRVDAFEAAKVSDADARIADFLPSQSHPAYRDVLLELLRVDLEFSWKNGTKKRVDDYRNSYAEILDRPESLTGIAFEEYRLRWQSGESVDRAEYGRRFGISTDDWPVLSASASETSANNGGSTEQRAGIAIDVERRVSRTRLPEIGKSFLGFEILEQLGQGAVGHVYLARQPDLANRLVVLKVSSQLWHEADRIARLQHTNIVPIHSVHRTGGVQAICMPFFGRATLADVLKQIRTTPCADRSAVSLRPPAPQLSETIARDANGNAGTGPESPAGPESLSYEDACLQLVKHLADALHHAHQRDIWHQDLKPANVLLSDHGQPMLLDFNLSATATDEDVLVSGGTLPYMAPEQIQGLSVPAHIGPWSDIYGLGVILFELLAGRRPFTRERRSRQEDWQPLIDERNQLPPVCDKSTNATEAMEAIVHKCLAPDSAQRYASAAELSADLQRQLDDLPLRHAPNQSWQERSTKWLRRHPRLTSGTSVVALAATVILVMAALLSWRGRELRHLKALERLGQLQETLAAVRAPLSVPGTSQELVDEAIQLTEQRLQDFVGADLAGWREHPHHTALDPSEQRALSDTMGQLFYLMAGVSAQRANLQADADRQRVLLADALSFSRLSAAAFQASGIPPAVAVQKSGLTARLEHTAETADDNSVLRPLSSTTDLLLQASHEMRQGDFATALSHLATAKTQSPHDFNVWLLLGHSHAALGNLQAAEDDFTSAAVLWPESYLPVLFRGFVRLSRKEFDLAERDFDTVIRLRPQCRAAYIDRAITKLELGQFKQALADLDYAIAAGNVPTRVFFLRSKVRKRIGDLAGARSDRAEGFRREPTDEASWIARAVARLPDDPKTCEAELMRVLDMNPASTRALQNLAHVYGEYLDAPDRAIDTLNRMICISTQDATARAGRGVFHARMGRRDAAIRDAQAALELSDDAQTIYQVACVYALTSVERAEDADLALGYLARANLTDPRWLSVAASDPDLKSLQDRREFTRLIAAGALIRETSRKVP